MSYPRDLDEYRDEEIIAEERRRRLCKRSHECFYCSKRLDSGHACKLNAHNQPVPADISQEAILQELARDIETSLPSRRAFALVVVRYGEEGVDEDPDALASYVSSLDRPQAARLLLRMGMSLSDDLKTKTT